MRHINGVYTQIFNKRHHLDGQLFGGRYKSILVEADRYLLQLLRYIHRNPLRAGLVEKLDDYNWSSHKGYQSNGKKWDWLNKDPIFSMLTEDKKRRLRSYKEFVSKEDDSELSLVFKKEKIPCLLGSKKFIEEVKERFFREKDHKEVPESVALAPEIERIKEIVGKAYQVKNLELLVSKRGIFNEPRNAAIYLTRQLRRSGLDEICKAFQMRRYSSASSAIERMKNKLSKNKEMSLRVEKIKLEIIKEKSQSKT